MSDGVYTVTESTAPPKIAVGMYQAKFTEWEESEDGKFGPYLKLNFEVTDGESAGATRSMVASSKMTKGKSAKTTSKLFGAVSGMLGREPSPSEQVALNDLVGTECMILVEDRPGDSEWQEISKVLPLKK